ncbi:MAG: hypothetical protein LBH35_06555 [Treponema sp.]|nr:hypothetical protein [Treponema sp.]
MKTAYAFAVLFLILAVSGFAQEPADSILSSYQRHFIRAGLGEKANVLSDAATDDRAGDFIGPLYEFALRFALDNAVLFRNDGDMENLVYISLEGIRARNYASAAETLWQAFRVFPDNGTKIEILNTLAVVDSGASLAERLNRLLREQNGFFDAGLAPNYPILRALVSILGRSGDESSYETLFEALFLPYNGDLLLDIENAIASLGALRGDLGAFLARIILSASFPEKEAAFRFGMRQDISTEEKAGLAEAALEAAGGHSGEAERELRLRAAGIIRELRWTRAFPLVVKYFYAAEQTYQSDPRDDGSRAEMFEAIQCLAAMESADAAVLLGLRLNLANSRMEFAGDCDADLTVAVIDALGALRYKASYDSLNYAVFLPYPEHVKNSAREALKRLDW